MLKASTLSADPSQLVTALFALLPLPVAIVNDANDIVIANSYFTETFPGVKNLGTMSMHEVVVEGRGTFDLELLPLNDQGLQICYGVDVSNEACLRGQLTTLEQQLKSRFKPADTNQSFDVNEAVRNVIRLRQQQLNDAKIVVSMNLHSKLPPVKGDPKAIEKVLKVFLSNAEHAIRSAEQSGSIHIRTWSENGRVRMSICDSGCGMSARHLHASSVSVAIGLCAEIIKDHGGELVRWNSYSSGSIYTMELPAASETT